MLFYAPFVASGWITLLIEGPPFYLVRTRIRGGEPWVNLVSWFWWILFAWSWWQEGGSTEPLVICGLRPLLTVFWSWFPTRIEVDLKTSLPMGSKRWHLLSYGWFVSLTCSFLGLGLGLFEGICRAFPAWFHIPLANKVKGIVVQHLAFLLWSRCLPADSPVRHWKPMLVVLLSWVVGIVVHGSLLVLFFTKERETILGSA